MHSLATSCQCDTKGRKGPYDVSHWTKPRQKKKEKKPDQWLDYGRAGILKERLYTHGGVLLGPIFSRFCKSSTHGVCFDCHIKLETNGMLLAEGGTGEGGLLLFKWSTGYAVYFMAQPVSGILD